MLTWAFVAAAVLFVATVALVRFSMLTRQARALQKTIESVKTELGPAARELIDEMADIRSRVEQLRGREGSK